MVQCYTSLICVDWYLQLATSLPIYKDNEDPEHNQLQLAFIAEFHVWDVPTAAATIELSWCLHLTEMVNSCNCKL